MTTCYFDTCHCVVEYPDRPFDESLAVFVQQCRTHNRPSESFAHNRSFNTRHGNTPTKPQDEAIARDRILERLKPEFQRR